MKQRQQSDIHSVKIEVAWLAVHPGPFQVQHSTPRSVHDCEAQAVFIAQHSMRMLEHGASHAWQRERHVSGVRPSRMMGLAATSACH